MLGSDAAMDALMSGDATSKSKMAKIDPSLTSGSREEPEKETLRVALSDGEGIPAGGLPLGGGAREPGFSSDVDATAAPRLDAPLEPPLEREPWSPPPERAKRFPWSRSAQKPRGDNAPEAPEPAQSAEPPAKPAELKAPPILERAAPTPPEAAPELVETLEVVPLAPKKPAAAPSAEPQPAPEPTPAAERVEPGPEEAGPLPAEPAPAPIAAAPPAAAPAVAEGDAPDAEEAARRADEAAAKEAAERAAFIEENSLGSLLFGARATAGKPDLKEVERDLKIKARYLKAIEEVDPDNLPSEAYLSGYVKTYAAYLKDALFMTPDEALAKFRRELAVKLGRDPDAEPEPEKTIAAPARVSSKVAPTIARKAAKGATPPPTSAPEADGVDGVRVARKARAGRTSPAEALKARAEAARSAAQAGDPLAKTRAPRGAGGKTAQETEAPAGGIDGAAVVAQRRREAMQRQAARVAEAQRMSKAASGAAAGSQRGFEAIGPLLAGGVAIAVVGGLLYGGYSLLSEAQRVIAPGEGDRALTVVERLDPASGAAEVARPSPDAIAGAFAEPGAPRETAAAAPSLGWAPEIAPVDGPIGGISPSTARIPDPGSSAPEVSLEDALAEIDAVLEATPAADDLGDVDAVLAEASSAAEAAPAPAAAASPPLAGFPEFGVAVLAETWFRVTDGAGEVVISRQLPAGEVRSLDPGAGPYAIRTGNAGGLALVVNGQVRGPLGQLGRVADLMIAPAEAAARFPLMAPESAALAQGLPIAGGETSGE